jgi:hypothetical protein
VENNKSSKNEFASFLKWMVLIVFTAMAFYVVYPKYTYILKGGLRINKITGEVCEEVYTNEYGVLQFCKRP